MDGVVLAISLLDGDGSHRPAPGNNSDATQHWPQYANQTPPYQRQCDRCPFALYASSLRNPKFITPLVQTLFQTIPPKLSQSLFIKAINLCICIGYCEQRKRCFTARHAN